MTQLQFWLLTILTMFFVTIGITCLAVMLGFFKNADERFKRWAIPGFFAGVVSAWFSLFRLAFVASSMIVTLNMPLDAPGLKSSGTYEYLVIQDKQVERHTGSLQVGFVPPGGWQAIIPDVAPNSAVTLHIEDERGGWWQVGPFFANVIIQDLKKGEKFVVDARPSIPGVAVVAAAEVQAQRGAPQIASVKFNNYARKTADKYGRAFYEWRIFVDEPQSVLNTIASVDYLLHPTFPQPSQSSSDRSKQFDLTASGWGGFTVLITVHFTNGSDAQTTYFLDLTKSWPETVLQLSLEKIRVEWDGSASYTNWVFEVFANGKSIARLANARYDDGGSAKRGRDYLAAANKWPSAIVKAPGGAPLRIEIKGTPSRGGPAINGTGTLTANGGMLTVNVANATDRTKGSFIFYFTARTSTT
jgi:hypothetical protein